MIMRIKKNFTKNELQNREMRMLIYDYIIYNNDIEIKRFALVAVDGYRAKLPLPKVNTNIIKRNDYYLARLFL